MNLRIITKNHAADPEIEFPTKSISKPYDGGTVKPPAWELTSFYYILKLTGCKDCYNNYDDDKNRREEVEWVIVLCDV